MNVEMAYLMGMIIGNGEIQRGRAETTISISLPHKTQYTDAARDVLLAVRASVADIMTILQPVVGAAIRYTQKKSETTIFFTKSNADYLITEIVRLCGSHVSYETMRIPDHFFSSATSEEIKSFLRGLADVTAHIRNSNMYFNVNDQHRVYIEVPQNWLLVVDICNLLRKVDVPVQTIDWAHPNMRDGNVRKYNEGHPDFWKKEHQIKIFANEFLPIGFSVIHKSEGLKEYAKRLEETYKINHYGANARELTHRYYWETRDSHKVKPHHPGESDPFIPEIIRGKHFNSWKEIAAALGYKK